MARFDRQKLYDRMQDFFDLDGNGAMKLTREAAVELCSAAGKGGLAVVKVEGGIWRGGQFEARLDAIWDGLDPPANEKKTHQNNMKAASFIGSVSDINNAFVVTCIVAAGDRDRASVGVHRAQVGNR